MFHPNYPNLELLEYIAAQFLRNDATFIEKCKNVKQNLHPDLDVQVFPQIWGSTCMGIDVTPDGSPAIGGCAMTKAYTSVFHEQKTNMYIVFFGDRAAYKVENPTKEFIADLKERNLAPLSKAKLRY